MKEQFKVDWESNVVFTYGDVISTSRGVMTEDLLYHEGHHVTQQKEYGGADEWWKEYLENPQFRFEQELECYRKQYQWVVKNIENRQVVFSALTHYARSLSGEMYGSIVSFNEAMKLIKEKV